MFLTSLLLFMNLSFAATTSPDCTNLSAIENSKNLSAETKASIREACNQLGQAQKTQVEQERKLADLETNKKYCGGTAFAGFWSRIGKAIAGETEEERKACADAVAKAQADLDKTKRDAEALQASIKRKQSEFQRTVSSVVALDAAIETDVRLVQDEYQNARLAVATLRIETAEGRERLNKIERAIDLSVMGQYMKERMAGLLNSPSLCEAAKACAEGKPRNINARDFKFFSQPTQVTTPVSSADTTSAAPAAATAPAAPARTRTRQ